MKSFSLSRYCARQRSQFPTLSASCGSKTHHRYKYHGPLYPTPVNRADDGSQLTASCGSFCLAPDHHRGCQGGWSRGGIVGGFVSLLLFGVLEKYVVAGHTTFCGIKKRTGKREEKGDPGFRSAICFVCVFQKHPISVTSTAPPETQRQQLHN